MSNGWTEEHRQRQAERIRAWRPWERSTGPRTAAGKNACKGNATTHGMRSATHLEEARQVREVLRETEDLLRAVAGRFRELKGR